MGKQIKDLRLKIEDWKGLSLRACGEAILLRNETRQRLLQVSKAAKADYISSNSQEDCRTALRFVRNDRLSSFSLIAIFLLASCFLLLTSAFAQTTELERQVFEISRELRCPVCTSESVADSNGDVSVEMREIIQEKLEAGESREEIMVYFQASYGDWILLDPPKSGLHLVVWLLPLIAGAIGVALLAYLFRRWTLRSAIPVEASEEDLRRVREALEQ